MKFSQGMKVLVGCALVLGCEVTESPLCSSNDARQAMEPGTKLSKGDLKVACECGAVANEHSDCCDGCPFGDAIVCRSESIKDSNGFGINTCAGRSPEATPDPRCSLEDSYLTAIVNPPLQYVGEALVGPVTFAWGWFNPHTTELADSDSLIERGQIPDELLLRAWQFLEESEAVSEEVGWGSALQPCETDPQSKTLTLNEATDWYYTITNLPGGVPVSNVLVFEPFDG